MQQLFAFVLLVGVLAACTATGEKYESLEPVIAEVPDASARIVFFRNSESPLASGRKAMVSIDGSRVGGCYMGGFFYRDVPAGEHELLTDLWDVPGHCEVVLRAEAGETYYFQLEPRWESYESSFWPYVGGLLIDPTGMVGFGAGMGGAVLESHGKQCGGVFRLRRIDAYTARLWLKPLHLSD